MSRLNICFNNFLTAILLFACISAASAANLDYSFDSAPATINIDLNGQTSQVQTITSVAAIGSEVKTAVFDLNDSQSFLTQSGQPKIPFQTIRLLLPPTADISSVQAKLSASYSTVEGNWNLTPTPALATRDENDNEIIIWPENANIIDGYDVDVYSSNYMWPAIKPKNINSGQLRSYKLTEMAIPLFRYNPTTGVLERLSKANLDVTTATQKDAKSSDTTDYNYDSYQRVMQLTDNFSQAAYDYPVEELTKAPNLSDTGYVIITTNDIKNKSTKLASFVAHKQSKFTVNVITESQYGYGSGDTAAENIHAWLKNNYTNTAYGNGGILYVLLIGDPRTDSSSVPMKMCRGDLPTDYYYAELTGNWDPDGDGIYGEEDEYNEKNFEVYVGRIPYYNNINDTDHILQKLIDYDNSTDTSWRRNALLPMVPLDDSTQAYQMGEQIKYNCLEPVALPSTRIYSQNYGLNPAPEYLLEEKHPATAWAEGIYGMVIWQTHGNTEFAGEIISSSDTPNLNDNYPSAVWQGSCLTGHPETTTNLGYSILKNGGIGTVAASRNGIYWVGETNFTNTASVGGLGYQYAKRIVERKSLGQALYDTKEYLGFWVQNYYVYNLYGDPSTVVMPAVPDFTITPTHGTTYNTVYGGTTTNSSEYTLYNRGSSSVSWSAQAGDADWYTLSATSGTIYSNSSTKVQITPNAVTTEMPIGTYEDLVTFTNNNTNESVVRTVRIVIDPKKTVAYWPFNETNGTTAVDASGNGHDATVTGSDFETASADAKSSTGFNFDGNDDHILVPGFSENMTGLTISFWMNVNDWGGNRRILQKGGDGSEYRVLVEWDEFVFEVGNTRLELSELPATNQWVHVAAVYDGNQMRVYYNKQLKGSKNRTGMVPSSTRDIYIGSKDAGSSGSDRFSGILDELKIFNFAQDDSGIADLYDCKDLAQAIYPYNVEGDVTLLTSLEWSMGIFAANNDVYFGSSYSDVANANTSSPEYKGRQSATTYNPGTLTKYSDYYWRIDQVDASGNVTPGNVWHFITGNGCGAISRQLWFNISGNQVTNLTNNSRYPNSPDQTGILTSFEAPSNIAENYGQRIYGFLIPPASGSYTFWIASDDYSELWLSSDDTPANASKIAYAYGATGSREWTKYGSQQSSPIVLTEGKPYYIMALHKEGAIGDNIAVAFSGPGINREVIPGSCLMPYANDYNWGSTFEAKIIHCPNAIENNAYSTSIAQYATSGTSGSMTFSKAGGPLWLNVSEDGILSGTPDNNDTGSNIFEIHATDSRGDYCSAVFTINVINTFNGEDGLADFAGLAANWMVNSSEPASADLTNDGTVDISDLQTLAANWMNIVPAAETCSYWPFDADMSDASADNDATAYGDAQISSDGILSPLGTAALLLDGDGDYVVFDGFKGITGTASRTCMAWVNTTSTSQGMIMNWGSSNVSEKWMFRVESDGTLGLGIWGGAAATSATVNDGNWHHVAAVLNDDGDPDISEVLFYIDGQLQESTSINNQAINTSDDNNLLIGAVNPDSPTAFFNGMIDDARLFNYALTSDEISNYALTNLDVYLPFSEGFGSTTADNSLNNRSATLNNQPSWVPDYGIDGAIQFDGTNDYVEVANYKGILGSASRTCTAWIKTETYNKFIMGWGTTDIGAKWLVRLHGDGTLRTEVSGGYIFGSTNIADNQWHHIAVVLPDDGSTDISEALLYVDGQLETNCSAAACPVNTASAENVKIGTHYASTAQYFNGMIDEVKIYNSALSQKDIKELYQGK